MNEIKVNLNSDLPSSWNCIECGEKLYFLDFVGYEDGVPCITFKCSNEDCNKEYVAKYNLKGLYKKEE